MTKNSVVVVAGMGEVGKPLCRILSRKFSCMAVDIKPIDVIEPCSVLHICYPYSIRDYVGTTANYVRKYAPRLTVVNSTVAPGTTRQIQEAVGDSLVAYSPVRGKHARMEQDMMRYKKFVGAPRLEATRLALAHFSEAGFATDKFASVELGELAKLLETTYLGMLIAWAQEMERVAFRYGGSFEDVNVFIKEIDFLPAHVFPGEIGGHCVLPNIEILRSQVESKFLDMVLESNQLKQRMYAVA